MSELMDLATINSQAPAVNNQDFNALVSSANYFPRIQLMTSNTEAAKSGKVPVNSYVIVEGKDAYTQLGKEAVVLPLEWRPFALSTKDNPIVSSHDQKSALFQQIQAKAGIKDSGAMFGPEFLCWVPSAGKFATLFFGSVSARKIAPIMTGLLRKPTQLSSKSVSTKTHTWYAIDPTEYSPGIDAPEMPSREEYESAMEKFKNPPETKVEMANEPAADR